MSDKQFKTWLRHRLEVLAWHCKVDSSGPKKKLDNEEINRRLHALVEESDQKIPKSVESGILSPIAKAISIKIAAQHTPPEYFMNREGLYVWSDFKSRIVEKAFSTKPGASFKLKSFKLNKDAVDEKIELSLPKKHLFSETEVCAIIAELVSKQSKGEEGVLLNNGYANLFYTKIFVVSVYWVSGGRRWSVDAWQRGDVRWCGGARVFSPAH